MGYDIEWHFNPDERLDSQEILDRFKAAGVPLDYEHGHPRYSDAIICLPGGFGGFLSSDRDSILKGNWVSSRCPEDRESLEAFTSLAKKVGAKLYDPQLNMEVTEETIPRVLEYRRKCYSVLSGFLGTVKDKEQREKQ